ncbi:hypothetical protein [Aliikangiella sp. G2MR2-5]|uniref:hypothetical protein n=1 Tax=Aliikangiella sp. G2MR2-5 TaxID=2788943 RepID=UPI0018AAA087|nr:hypothetical protein [Aliikangiella sp. G2MR2-5]
MNSDKREYEFVLANVYSEFFKIRHAYRVKEWASIKSFFYCFFTLQGGYVELLSMEDNVNKEMLDWVDGHFKTSNCSQDEIQKCRVNLKMYKEELVYRNTFLVLFIPILVLSITIGSLVEGSKIYLLVINGLFSI